MSTLAQIRADVQANWPTGYHSDDLDSDKIDEYINNDQRWICRGSLFLPDKHIIHNFSWLKRETTADTVDEQRRYELPDGSGSIWKFKVEKSCELINSESYRVPLKRMLKQDIENDSRFKDTTGKGAPSVYCIDDGDLWLYLLPDHSSNSDSAWTINLEYYGYLPVLSDSNTTNTITNDYPEVLEYGATEQGYRFGMDEEQAEYWKAKKIEIFLEMLKVDQALQLSGLETGMQPIAGVALGEGQPSVSGHYHNPTHYD